MHMQPTIPPQSIYQTTAAPVRCALEIYVIFKASKTEKVDVKVKWKLFDVRQSKLLSCTAIYIPIIISILSPIMTDYDGLKAAELKDLLKERGIASTGMTRKQQYIEALEAQDAQEAGGDATNEGEQEAEETHVEPAGENADATANADSNADQEPSDAPQQSSETPAVPVTDDQSSGQNITSQVEPPALEDQSDNLKRKRSSPTPLEDDESTQKKLKPDQDAIAPEDVKEEAPVPVDSAPEEIIEPMPVSDDVMDVTGQDDATGVKDAAAERQPSTEPMAVDTEPSDSNNVDPPSTHPPTSALYIRNLLRPLQVPPFREHLLELATPNNETPDDSLIETIHLDTFKSHAFVIFTSPSSAIRARAGLHDRIWPEETQRKALWVDFVPSDKAQTWIATETEAGKSKRFEVIYSTSPETGAITASLEEASQHHNNNSAPSAAAAASSLPGPGMPNAPTGPRGDRSHMGAPTAPTAPASQQPAYAPRKPLHTPASLSHFPSTTASPKIFYQPVPQTLVEKRLEELERETSRDWDGGRQKPFGTALDQLRRYTFEDGDVVVDGGVDFGGFGKDRGAGGGGGHGGGFGGNGGGGGRRRGGRGRR